MPTLLNPTDPFTSLSTMASRASSLVFAVIKQNKLITEAEKEELRLYFIIMKEALNTGLPQVNYSRPLNNLSPSE